jgi:hypothetical protein
MTKKDREHAYSKDTLTVATSVLQMYGLQDEDPKEMFNVHKLCTHIIRNSCALNPVTIYANRLVQIIQALIEYHHCDHLGIAMEWKYSNDACKRLLATGRDREVLDALQRLNNDFNKDEYSVSFSIVPVWVHTKHELVYDQRSKLKVNEVRLALWGPEVKKYENVQDAFFIGKFDRHTLKTEHHEPVEYTGNESAEGYQSNIYTSAAILIQVMHKSQKKQKMMDPE